MSRDDEFSGFVIILPAKIPTPSFDIRAKQQHFKWVEFTFMNCLKRISAHNKEIMSRYPKIHMIDHIIRVNSIYYNLQVSTIYRIYV